ncbi:hypothetical protein TNCV_2113301 [Trichonephila clavipes]|nr:hypothetical protein TNCV_2113301 [Trichonephila clavipes]
MSSPRVRRRGIQRLYSAEDEVLDKIVQELAEWCVCFIAGLLHPMLWARLRPKLMDFHDAENRQWPCRMIVRHGKDP